MNPKTDINHIDQYPGVKSIWIISTERNIYIQIVSANLKTTNFTRICACILHFLFNVRKETAFSTEAFALESSYTKSSTTESKKNFF